MRELLVTLGKLFEAVVIDTPALGIVSDAMTLVPLVSNALVVGGLGKTTRDGGEKFMAQFSIAGRQPIGLVATFTRLERNQYSYYRRSGDLFHR
jgi:Mrp family chromosome partitioning ATPase